MATRMAVTRARRLGRRLRGAVPHLTRKLATLSFTEWRYLVQAQLALLWAQALVWVRPLGRLVDSAPAGGTSAANGTPRGDETPGRPALGERAGVPPLDPTARQLALSIRRAAAYGVFRPLCLVRSVALSRMLEGHGFHGSRIRVGVQWVNGRFAAHAWVEYDGHVLGDDVEHVSRFADLSEVRVLKWS